MAAGWFTFTVTLPNWFQVNLIVLEKVCNGKLSTKIEELETRLEDLNANKKKRMDKEVIIWRINKQENSFFFLTPL